MVVENAGIYGSWIELKATSTGGKRWIVQSTGVSAGEGAGKFVINNATDAINAVVINSSGNVGIGTSSPSQILDIVGTTPMINIQAGANTNARGIQFNYNGSTIIGSLINYGATGENALSAGSSGTSGYFLTFKTDGSERMRITSGGLVLVGTTSHTDGSMFQTTSSFTSLNAYRQTSGGSGVMGFYSNNYETKGVVAYIKCDGGLANYSANNLNLSDERTKNSIIPIESYWDKFKAIEIVKFKYNGQVHDDYNIGVIAQQVESVAPEFVSNDGWGVDENNKQDLKSIYESDLHHTTIAVLQEAMARIEEQQALITSLQEQINELKNK